MVIKKDENKLKPKFKRRESIRYKKLSRGGWRKPRGIHHKVRLNRGGKGESPSIGYGTKAEQKGVHPSGYMDVLVENPSQLATLDKERDAVRISGRVGDFKAQKIMEDSKKLGLKILNPREIRAIDDEEEDEE
ncbi:MAG: 50S ribosomal protein L32e [Desulfatiglandales bacterium]